MLSKIKENTNKIPWWLFYIGLNIELLMVLIDRSALPPMPEGYLYRLTFILFALKVCFTKYTKKEWLWLISFILFTALMYYFSGQNVALRAVFFVAAMRDIEIKSALKYAFWLTLSGFLTIIALSFLGIGRDIKRTDEFRVGIIETRYDFGIGHANTFYCMILMLLFLLFYCYREKMKISILLLLFAVNIALFIPTDSRTGFLVCTLAILSALIFYIWPKLREVNWIYFAGIAVFIACIGFSVWAAHVADSVTPGSFAELLDRFLTGRIRLIHNSTANIERWQLFATDFETEKLFDMGWVRMFSWLGIIPGIVICIMHLLLVNVCRIKKDYMGLLLIVIAAVYTIAEPQFISALLGRNYLLFLFGAYWGPMLKADNGNNYNWWQVKGAFLKSAD